MSVATVAVSIERNRDGVLLVGGTRVTLDTIVTAFSSGAAAEEIALRYPSLQLADIYSAISYYLRNEQSVENYLQERRQQAAIVRSQNELRSNSDGLRRRLIESRSKPLG